MTVGTWVSTAAEAAPTALQERMLSMLQSDAELAAVRAPECCLSAATRSLQALLDERRFTRSDALDLLAIDALVTIAFEGAAVSSGGLPQLSTLVERATTDCSRLADVHG